MSNINGMANELYHYQGGYTAGVLSDCCWNDAVGRSIKGRIEEIVSRELDAARTKTFEGLSKINTEHIEKALELAEAHLSMG